MKSLEQLINTREPGWPVVRGWIDAAKRPVEVLPTTRARAEATLVALQVTTRSPMGAIALETGGILVDRGWVRVFGSGGARMRGDLASWNGLGDEPLVEASEGLLLVANDAVGGFFALDGGALGPGEGDVFYFAPDTLEWEDLEIGYSGFIDWLMTGDVDKFYVTHRWQGWEKDVAAISPDQGFSIQPPLWAEEGGSTGERDRRAVPIEELFGFQMHVAAQMRAAG